jgi:hypothetical protein
MSEPAISGLSVALPRQVHHELRVRQPASKLGAARNQSKSPAGALVATVTLDAPPSAWRRSFIEEESTPEGFGFPSDRAFDFPREVDDVLESRLRLQLHSTIEHRHRLGPC